MSNPNPQTLPTPERIKKHDWWWRRPQKGVTIDGRGRMKAIPGDPHGVLWKDGNEAAVFKFELCRRIDTTLPKWMELSREAAELILSRLREGTSISFARQGGKFATLLTPRKGGGFHATGQVEDKGHCVVVTPNGQDLPDHTELIQFNLNATDSALRKFFVKFIAEQRRDKRVKPAKLPRKNAFSWHWLEVWDLSEKDRVALDESERSMKANAKKTAEKWLPLVRNALADAETLKKSSPAKPQ